MLIKRLLAVALLIITSFSAFSQSFEFMLGTERLFVDAQFLKFVDKDKKVSLFTRARATAEYEEPLTNLFTGAYLNYTTSSGVGGTVLGRISSPNSGIDAGLHYFKARKTFMVYALAAVNVHDNLLYSWFSIFRYTPKINDKMRLYSSLELFSAFGEVGHLSSVQRIRLGVWLGLYQFGGAINLNERRFIKTDINPGVFVRTQF